jgi:hypothetical protein
VLGSFGFYIISRIMGFAVSSIIIPSKINNVDLNIVLELTLKGLSSLLPRLDLFTQSKWLIYTDASSSALGLVASQSAIYIVLIMLMSVFDFNKKQF